MRRALFATTIVVALASPSVGRAQNQSDVARADTLFNAAKVLLDQGQYAEACAQFAESKRLAPGLGVTLYLADCYERIGRTASAWMEFRSAEGMARARNDRRADVAHERAQTLEPNLDRLTISIAASVPRDGLEVMRDGFQVTPDQWGLAVPVDPGDHTIVVLSPGHPQKKIVASVGPDNSDAVVHIDDLDPTPAEGAAPSPPAATPPAETSEAPASSEPTPADTTPGHGSGGGAQKWIGIGLGAAGVVGLGVGVAFGFMAKSKLDDSNSGGTSAPCDRTDRCTSQGLSMRKDAESTAMTSTIAFAAGGVALAAGLVLVLTAPHDASGEPAVAAAVAPGPHGGAGVLRIKF
jgi:serine/threonine-protein kinase